MMSGGHFNFIQSQIDNASVEISDTIESYKKTCSPDTLLKMREAEQTLELAAQMLQRVDWFISGDDGEASFNRRWDEVVLTLKDEQAKRI
jgi:hypothetical protein